ncbi:MAG: site-specific tyrosine recombinase XerD [Actinomycetota bacterium]
MEDPGSLEHAAREHEAWLAGERGVSTHTLAAYRRDLAHWLGHLRALGRSAPDEVEEGDLTAYLGTIRSRRGPDGDLPGLAPASVNRRMAAIRSFHRFCVREGLAAADPTRHVRSGNLAKALPKALPVAEVVRLIEAPDLSSVLGLRDRAMLELLYGCGMRASELTALDRDDVDLETRTVRCLGKGGKERVVPLGRHARAAVEAYLVRARPELAARSVTTRAHPLFLSAAGRRLTRQGLWKIVKTYAERIELPPGVTPHALRHSCATHMLDGGADIRVVQETLGHARLTTTQVYTAVSQERLVEAYLTAHPRAGRRG